MQGKRGSQDGVTPPGGLRAGIVRQMTPVYGSSGPRRLAGFVLACAMAVPTSCRGDVPPEPRLAAETASAFARYLEQAEARNAGELRAGTPVFWIDGLPEKDRAAAYAALKRGEVKLRQLEVRDAAGKKLECPHGMIHHWAGVIFIPDANLEDALGLLEDYNQHAKYYSPDVERSQIETHDGDHFRVMMRFRRHKVVTVVLNTEQDINYFRDSPTRAHSRSSAVRIVQVENAGRKDERERPEGDDDGFLWRMETWWRMDERDGGVYVQSEALSLTRDIPTGLGWLIGPFVTGIPRESLSFTLGATRKGVQERRQASGGR